MFQTHCERKPRRWEWDVKDIIDVNTKLSNSNIHHVVVYDECAVNPFYFSEMRAKPNMDIVMIIPYKPVESPRLPSENEWVKHLRLEKSYRQSQHCVLAYNYLSTHREYGKLNLSQTISDADEDRCPEGFKSVWIECSSKKIFYKKALIRVKEILDSEGLGGLRLAVIGSHGSADKKFCLEQGWECSTGAYYGSE